MAVTGGTRKRETEMLRDARLNNWQQDPLTPINQALAGPKSEKCAREILQKRISRASECFDTFDRRFGR
ncbi:hypothetical protein OIDMADRAFT_20658 [Oidiodendron maius Zn]|uniref:Uncharacterized protein n=1 Tax=Oidiodendron maius (strain Zn) TaxID=913774 RepID=A0A0C3CD05_OIDMZ|nr:hypothetical protein OIDMADRAFT_20658 [Oidiodendron maius Zn]